MKKYLGSEVSIPHSSMLKFRKSGQLNLGINDDISIEIANNPNLAPQSKSTALALHFWSLVAVLQFFYFIYFSFTSIWWAFIPSFFFMFAIHRANKRGTSQNLLFEAERDKEFYEKIRKLDGWQYEINEEVAKKYKKGGNNL